MESYRAYMHSVVSETGCDNEKEKLFELGEIQENCDPRKKQREGNKKTGHHMRYWSWIRYILLTPNPRVAYTQ